MSTRVNTDSAIPPAVVESTSFHIEPLTPQHAVDAARLHIEDQPGTFLTRLGPDVLTVVYATLPDTDGGFGFAAVDDAHCVAGFVSATTSVGNLFMQTGVGKAGSLLPALTKRMLKQPSLLWMSAKTLFYPFMVQHGDVDADNDTVGTTAELLSIMVSRAYRGHGIGARLVDTLLVECSHRDIATLDVTVDAANPGARQFYTRHEFIEQKVFTMYGREMCQYKRSI